MSTSLKQFIVPTVAVCAMALINSPATFAEEPPQYPGAGQIGTPPAPSPGMAQSGFMSLDRDGDGQITKTEAASQPGLVEKFNEADTDGDGMLNSSEFAAFELPAQDVQQ